MKQTRNILPVYTCDVSGVCSALYELGGLVVMHDPSGCNSTYNTHDEIRWYEKDSLIFISGLTERDAILGNDEKFCRDVLETVRQFDPAFIAITNSPIPYLTGTDFEAIVRYLAEESGLPAFYVPANGMHDYTAGAGGAFQMAARKLVFGTDRRRKDSVNLLGVTPLDFAASGSAKSLRAAFSAAGFSVRSLWAMDDSLQNLRCAGDAAVNVVLSSAGLAAAKELYRRFGTPYVAGVPVGGFAQVLMDAVRDAQKTGMSGAAYRGVAREGAPQDKKVTLIGEPVMMGSLAAAIRMKYGCVSEVLCPLETFDGLLTESDRAVYAEEDLACALSDAQIVVADPFYKPLCGPRTVFYALPTLSLSGRSWLKDAKDPVLPLSEI